jgi:hypothetical protein
MCYEKFKCHSYYLTFLGFGCVLSIVAVYDTPHVEGSGPSPIRAIENLGGCVEIQGSAVTGIALCRTNAEIWDADLVQLQTFKKLRNLSIWSPGVTNSGLVHLAALDRLEELVLSAPVDDEGLFFLKDLVNLSYLNLSGTDVTGTGFKYLRSLTKLKVLSLDHSKVNASGVKQIQRLKNLEHLSLSSTNIDDSVLVTLSHLKKLICVNLNSTKITGRGIIRLKSLEALVSLDVGSTQLRGTFAAELQSLRKLRMLNLAHTGLCDDDLRWLKHSNGMEDLDLSYTRVTDRVLVPFELGNFRVVSRYPQLTSGSQLKPVKN